MYEGYLLEVNGLKLPYIDGVNIFENGTYTFQKEHRSVYDWTDITGINNHEVTPAERATIRFKIKERTLEQQEKLEPLFSSLENMQVTYYDDYLCRYVTGFFYVSNKTQTTGIATRDNIYYKAEEIVLKEY